MDTWNSLQMTCGSPIWHVGHLYNVNIEVIPHFFTHDLWVKFLIVLSDVSYTDMQGSVQDVIKVSVTWDAFLIW